MTHHRPYRPRRPRRAYWIGVGIVLVVMATWLGYRTWTVRHELALAREEMAVVQAEAHGVIAGRVTGAELRRQLRAPTAHAERARAAANDPLFRTLGLLPWLGAPARTATGVSDAAYDVARTTLPALADAADYWQIVHDSQLSKGVPVDLLAKASGRLDRAVSGLERANGRLAKLPRHSWLGGADDARALLAAQVTTLLADVRPAAAVAELAPDMLGRRAVRHYLVAFENRAEARGTGGLLGALALVEARSGRLKVLRYTSNEQLPSLASVPANFRSDLAAESALLGIGTRWQNSNYGPDFGDAGAAWAAMYTTVYRVPIDGVLAFDPDGLAALMAVTGPVRVDVSGQTPIQVSASNVAAFVERDEYRLPVPRQARKDIQRQIAQQALDRLFSMATPPLNLVDALTRAAKLRHVLLMSLHPAEEKRLASWPVAGLLPTGRAPFAQLVVNNAAGSKLDVYLRTSLRYTVLDCSGSRRVRMTATLENTAPPGLPRAVYRHDDFVYGPKRQQNLDLVAIYGTVGARLLSANLDGSPIGTDPTKASPISGVFLRKMLDHGHPLWVTPLELSAGRARHLVLEILEGPSTAEPIMPTQPMTIQTAVSSDLNSCR